MPGIPIIRYVIRVEHVSYGMALREVKPLDENQWKQVSKIVADGPTKESVQNLRDALKMADKVREA